MARQTGATVLRAGVHGPRRQAWPKGGASSVADRDLHLGQQLYFVLWDEDVDLAAVAKGEVVEYASDHSKVRVKVVEAPQTNLVGRTSWILPDRLDDDARSARVHYQQRAREGLREEMGRRGERDADAVEGETEAVGEADTALIWNEVCESWGDIDLLLDSIDFEAGWPENQARLAKFAVLGVLHLKPRLEALLATAPAGEEADAVRAALTLGVLRSSERLAGHEPCTLLDRWADVPFEEIAEAGESLAALRTALTAWGDRLGLRPTLVGRAPVER